MKKPYNNFALMEHMIFIANLESFMRQSNLIEGESDPDGRGTLYEGDVMAALRFMRHQKITEANLKTLHFQLSAPKAKQGFMAEHERGAWRDCEVRVGKYHPPEAHRLHALMKDFFKQLNRFNAWEAHNHFEKIHPFVDLNGRVGRLVWLWKAYNEERFQFGLSFLQAYYYSTLNNFEKLKLPFYEKEKIPDKKGLAENENKEADQGADRSKGA